MTNITPILDTLNWKLLAGSHDFPGPEGGTCINEAAIVAAGFEYRKVGGANDCPPCFSRPIAQYAIGLNDAMPDDLRQSLLMPFVVRLAGTADADAVEQRRATYLAIQTVRRILPMALMQFPEIADQCRRVRTLDEAQAAANAAEAAANAAKAAARAAARAANAYAASAAAYAAARAANAYAANAYAAEAAANAAYAAYAAARAAEAAANAASAAYAAARTAEAAAYAARAAVWRESVAILGEAISIGKQAELIETALVVDRMDKMRELART
jgi:hypothetical protein